MIVLFLVGGFIASAAWGQAPSPEENNNTRAALASNGYRIELNAPRGVADYLQKYLDLYRMQKRKDVAEEDFLLLVDQVPHNVQSLLKTLGYFEAQTETQVRQDENGVTVVLKVDTGQQVRVTKVDVRVTGAIEQDEEMMAQFRRALSRWLWRLPEGAAFEQAAWDDSKRRVLDYFVSRRYATATITGSKAEVDLKTHQATLTVDIASGPSYVFGEVTIVGLESYPEKVVRDLIRFKPGAAYQRRDLLNLQSELQSLPYFGGVVVETLPSEEAPYVAAVTVTVQELPHNKLDLGVGFSTNYGMRLQTGYTYNNLWGRGWVFDSMLNLSSREQQAEVGLSFPKETSGYVNRLYAAFNDSNLQGIRSRVGKLGVSRSKTEGLIERIMSVEFINENRRDGYGADESMRALPFSYRWIRRDVQTQRNPRSGNILQLESSVAVKGLLTDESFARLYGRGIQYWPVGDNNVALARLEVGQTFTNYPEKVPSDYLFRAGGSNSVRGYDYQSLGIIHGVTAWPGRVLATGSVEYQQMVYKEWRAAVFADYGDAANTWGDWRGKTGVGVGARWVSPVGMLGADLAYGLNNQAWRFYFSLGMSL